jgi:hypothetical protein
MALRLFDHERKTFPNGMEIYANMHLFGFHDGIYNRFDADNLSPGWIG